jgi:hypothetical protein
LKPGGAYIFVSFKEGLPKFAAEEGIQSIGMSGGRAEDFFGFGIGDTGG